MSPVASAFHTSQKLCGFRVSTPNKLNKEHFFIAGQLLSTGLKKIGKNDS